MHWVLWQRVGYCHVTKQPKMENSVGFWNWKRSPNLDQNIISLVILFLWPNMLKKWKKKKRSEPWKCQVHTLHYWQACNSSEESCKEVGKIGNAMNWNHSHNCIPKFNSNANESFVGTFYRLILSRRYQTNGGIIHKQNKKKKKKMA